MVTRGNILIFEFNTNYSRLCVLLQCMYLLKVSGVTFVEVVCQDFFFTMNDCWITFNGVLTYIQLITYIFSFRYIILALLINFLKLCYPCNFEIKPLVIM